MAKYTVAVCDDEKEDLSFIIRKSQNMTLTSSLKSKLIQMANYFLTN